MSVVQIFVDELAIYPNAWGPFRSGSCHMFARVGDVDALHAFAARIGLKRAWFQPDPRGGHSHYDLTASKRILAVRAGAIELDRNATVTIWRENPRRVRVHPLPDRAGATQPVPVRARTVRPRSQHAGRFRMRVKHCEECLSRHGVYVLAWGDRCGCGHAPVAQLSPNEIRVCLGVDRREAATAAVRIDVRSAVVPARSRLHRGG